MADTKPDIPENTVDRLYSALADRGILIKSPLTPMLLGQAVAEALSGYELRPLSPDSAGMVTVPISTLRALVAVYGTKGTIYPEHRAMREVRAMIAAPEEGKDNG